MSSIYWLEVLKSARQLKHLSNHYILKVENKFLVLTSSKEIKGSKTVFISDTNVDGKKQAQFLYEKVHDVDYTSMFIKATQKGTDFFLSNHEKLEVFVKKLTE